jgi:hypothetical protein
LPVSSLHSGLTLRWNIASRLAVGRRLSVFVSAKCATIPSPRSTCSRLRRSCAPSKNLSADARTLAGRCLTRALRGVSPTPLSAPPWRARGR